METFGLTSLRVTVQRANCGGLVAVAGLHLLDDDIRDQDEVKNASHANHDFLYFLFDRSIIAITQDNESDKKA